MGWNTRRSARFNKHIRNLKVPTTATLPDPNAFANSVNTGYGLTQSEYTTPKRKRVRKKDFNLYLGN